MKKTFKVTTLIIALSYCGAANAQNEGQVVCNIDGNFFFESISWDKKTRKAKIKDHDGIVHAGEIVEEESVQNKEKFPKLYFSFNFEEKIVGTASQGDFMVFKSGDVYRIIGAGFSGAKEGESNKLELLFNNNEMSCIEGF